MAADEAALVRECLRGDARAIQALVECFQPDVFGLCVRILQHQHDAEDITQEVFLRVFRSLKSWNPERALKPWIMAIAINRCRTMLAQRGRRPRPSGFSLSEVPCPKVEQPDELLREIDLAILELRPDYRSVFVLFHEQGQSYEEIATVLDKPVGTIKTWLHRARLQILERLKQRGMVSEIEHELP